jgi:hypothetical protein
MFFLFLYISPIFCSRIKNRSATPFHLPMPTTHWLYYTRCRCIGKGVLWYIETLKMSFILYCKYNFGIFNFFMRTWKNIKVGIGLELRAQAVAIYVH